jgi:hypothetical protein
MGDSASSYWLLGNICGLIFKKDERLYDRQQNYLAAKRRSGKTDTSYCSNVVKGGAEYDQ